MIKRCAVMLIVCLAIFPAQATAWDYFYDCSVLPDDPSLGAGIWNKFSGNDYTQTFASDGILHITDTSADAAVVYGRFAVASGSPLTVEARVRIVYGEGTAIVAGTPAFATGLWLYSDRVDVYFQPQRASTYPLDLSQFRTIRIAMDSQRRSQVWIDDFLLVQGITFFSNQGDVTFGSLSNLGTNQSQWDYIACSAEFLPIPEPSSLMALGLMLIPAGAVILRRK